MAPHILSLGTRRERVFSGMSPSVGPRGKCPRYPLSNRLFGPKILFRCCLEQKEAHLFQDLTFDIYQIVY
jgi:hypothetical protein